MSILGQLLVPNKKRKEKEIVRNLYVQNSYSCDGSSPCHNFSLWESAFYHVQTQVEKKGCLTIQSADTTFVTIFFSYFAIMKSYEWLIINITRVYYWYYFYFLPIIQNTSPNCDKYYGIVCGRDLLLTILHPKSNYNFNLYIFTNRFLPFLK